MLQHSYTVAKLLRFGFLPARVRAVVWVMISILNSSCYTMISNEGEWSRPVVVPKTPELLADASAYGELLALLEAGLAPLPEGERRQRSEQ